MIHLSDDEISLFAIGRELVDSPDAAEAHLASCPTCRGWMEIHQHFDESLRGSEPWLVANPAADPYRQSLREMAFQTQREDEEADQLLAPLLAEPERVAWGELVNDSRYRTGGVVRRLCEAAHQVCPRVPEQALTLSKAAIAISVVLPDDLYPARAVSVLRGLAWKELANAARFLDRFHEAIEALARAESFHRHAASPEVDLAIIGGIRALLFFGIDDIDGADECAKASLEMLLHLGQELRSLNVMTVQGTVLRQRGEFTRSIETLTRVQELAESMKDPLWQRLAACNLSWSFLESGDPLTAAKFIRTARDGLAELGYLSDVTRCDWGLALVSRDLGNHREALTQLLAVSASFAEQKVVVDSATAMVEAFEIMLALGETEDIERLATGLVETFTEAGKMESALTALAYIKEAAAGKSITPEILRAARTFLRRVERHRDLIFVPPLVS
jgi:tetratricopeptide (TPR) repeat protein